MKGVFIGQAIEGERVSLETRKHSPAQLKEINGHRCYSIKTNIRTEAKIDSELPNDLAEASNRFLIEDVMLSKGDLIECEGAVIYTSEVRIPWSKGSNVTSKHSAYCAAIRKRTAVQVSIPFRTFLEKNSIQNDPSKSEVIIVTKKN